MLLVILINAIPLTIVLMQLLKKEPNVHVLIVLFVFTALANIGKELRDNQATTSAEKTNRQMAEIVLSPTQYNAIVHGNVNFEDDVSLGDCRVALEKLFEQALELTGQLLISDDGFQVKLGAESKPVLKGYDLNSGLCHFAIQFHNVPFSGTKDIRHLLHRTARDADFTMRFLESTDKYVLQHRISELGISEIEFQNVGTFPVSLGMNMANYRTAEPPHWSGSASDQTTANTF